MARTIAFLLVLLVPLGSWSHGAQPDATSPEEAAIRKADAAYLLAFNKHDTKALAEQWSPDAVYLNRITGEEVSGRAKIAEQFAAVFKERNDLKLDLNIESIQFVSPNVAVEHGSATLLAAKAEPDKFQYTAVFVKRDGRWLLDRVTDQAPEAAQSSYEQLKALEWMVGTWEDDAEDAQITTECNWTKNRSFLTRSFAVTVGDQVDLSGMQIIGWDAASKQIRSWTFDSDGGFAEAKWTFKGGRWYVSNQGVLADGRKASAVNIIKPVDDDSFTWQTISRSAGGELLPNIDEVLIRRK